MAAPAPGSCFDFDPDTGTIYFYFFNEGDNNSNPACPRALEIPSTIDGVPVTTVDSYALYDLDLTSVYVPSSITTVGDNAFSNNEPLTSIVFDGTLSSVGNGVLSGSPALQSITYDGTTYDLNTPVGEQCYDFDSGTGTINVYNRFDLATIVNDGVACMASEVTIPASIGGVPVTTLGDYSFNSLGLTSLSVPASVTSVGYSAFAENKIATLTFLGAPTTFAENILTGNPITTLVFDGNTYLESDPIPEECFGFSGGTITSYELYNLDFVRDQGLACLKLDVEVPNTIAGEIVTGIGYFALGNKALASVTMPNTVVRLDDYALAFNRLESITLSPALTMIGNNALASNLLESIAIPAGVTTLGEGAFSSNALTSAVLPNGLTSIGREAFAYNRLNSAPIPNSVTSIGERAFYENKLTEVNLPPGLTVLQSQAFANNNITSVTIPDSITAIPSRVFEANMIESLQLGNSVTSIGESAFASNKIQAVTLPASLTSLSEDAFLRQSPLGSTIDEAIFRTLAGRKDAVASIWYVRLFTADASNPANLQDNLNTVEADESQLDIAEFCGDGGCPIDYNGDGDTNDMIIESQGGHLINPAQATVTYKNTLGWELGPASVMSGIGLSGYRAAENATHDLNRYFRIGVSQPFVARSFAGYTSVSPTSPSVVRLATADTTIDFVYSGLPVINIPVTGAPNAGSKGTISLYAVLATILLLVSVAGIGKFLGKLYRVKRG